MTQTEPTCVARLRPDVTLHGLHGGLTFQLHDALLGRTLDLSPPAHAVVQALGGPHALHQVAAAAAAQHAQPRDACLRALRTLVRLTVVDGCGDTIRAQVAQAQRPGGSMVFISVPGARFACQGSGACCQNHRLGPLSDADVALLESLSAREGYPGGPAWEVRPGADGQPARYLPARASRCVFLDGASRCRLHAAFGPDGKPGFCRTFPLETLRTADGMRVWDRGLCQSLETSGEHGAPLLAQAPALVAAQAGVTGPLYHPMVFLHDAPVDFGHLTLFAHAARARLEHRASPSTPGTRLAWLASALSRWEHALNTFEPGVDAVEPLAAAAVSAMEAPGPPSVDAWAALVDDLRSHVGLLASEDFEFHALAEDLLPTLEGMTAGPVLPAASPPQDAALARTLQHHLLGRDVLLLDRPWPALLRLAAVQVAALHHAHRCGAPAFGRGHMVASRLFSMLDGVFLHHEANAAAALGALA